MDAPLARTSTRPNPSPAREGEVGGLQPAHQQQDHDHDQDDAENPRRAVAPIGAVAPARQRADQHQDEKNDENGPKHRMSPSYLEAVTNGPGEGCRTAAGAPSGPPMVDPVRPISLAEIEQARGRVAGTALRTPLVRLDLGSNQPEIYLKLENLQPTNAYKIRGATNAVARLSDEERARGVWTISAGNAGQGVAYAARAFGVPCSVVAIETAPQTKLDRMRALGAKIVPVSYETAWVAAESHAFEGMDATFIHPFDNHDFIAGHGTIGLEIVEDLPDVGSVIAAIGGGGLITGVGSAVKALRREVRVFGAEPETAAPFAYSLSQGAPSKFPDWQ